MPTLTDSTQFVTLHSTAAQEYLWEWFSAQVYALILKAEQDSLIVRVRQRFNLHKVAAAGKVAMALAGSVGQPVRSSCLQTPFPSPFVFNGLE